uniref:Uncharacterized protein n=1 Tax=Anguilla anguilla TaxID=7936 RepID=A0A0E9WFA0_ANGAN
MYIQCCSFYTVFYTTHKSIYQLILIRINFQNISAFYFEYIDLFEKIINASK